MSDNIIADTFTVNIIISCYIILYGIYSTNSMRYNVVRYINIYTHIYTHIYVYIYTEKIAAEKML